MNKTSIDQLRAPAGQERVKEAIFLVFFVLIFVSIVTFLRAFKPEAAGFEQKGWPLLLYHASRLGLMIYIAAFCYSVGYQVLALFRINPQELFSSARKTFIICFFFGASLYGIAFAALGLAGLINLVGAFALTIPALLFSYRPIKALLPQHAGSVIFRSFFDTHASPFFVWVIVLVSIAAVFLFVLTRVIFIPNVDGNIWEHYLHYYRAVLTSGSTQPNEVWHHFYNSKGGGLVFLANVLSDFFGVQLVSACFVGVSGLIILDLLHKYCRSMSWALFGTILFFIYLYGDVSSGAMFRVHGVLLGYVSFALWGSVRLQLATEYQFKALMIALVVSLAYLGFYLPVTTALLPATFLLISLTNSVLQDKSHLRPFLTLACAVCGGTVLALATNWALTGLAEVTPMRWFWEHADRAKVREVFGTGGIEFFLAVNNDLMHSEPWYQRIDSSMRYPLHSSIMWLSLLGAIVVLTQGLRRYSANQTLARSDKFLLQLGAFIIPLCAFALLVPSPSVYRMGLFSVVFVILAIVVIWKRIVSICFGSKFSHVTTVVIICLGVVSVFALATKNIKEQRQRPIIYKYAKGAISLKDALRAMESLSGRPPGTSVTAMSAFRRMAGSDGRILSLAYDAGYSYLLPGEGIISEPTYSVIRDPQAMLAEKPEKVADYLQKRNIKHFVVNLQSRLFSTVAFTSLFDPQEMSRYFSVAYEDGDFFILTWRLNGKEKPLSDYFLTLFELKRTGVLHYPFTEKISKLTFDGADQLVGTVADFEKAREEFLRDLDKTFITEMQQQVSLESSKGLLRRALGAGRNAVSQASVGEIVSLENANQLRRILEWGSDVGRIQLAEKIGKQELKVRFVKIFRGALYKQYETEVGNEIASLSRRCDERVPFAVSYPLGAICH